MLSQLCSLNICIILLISFLLHSPLNVSKNISVSVLTKLFLTVFSTLFNPEGLTKIKDFLPNLFT